MASKNLPLNPPFTFIGENYKIWSVKMQAFMESYELWEIVTKDKPFTALQQILPWLRSNLTKKRRQRNLNPSRLCRMLWQILCFTKSWLAKLQKRLGIGWNKNIKSAIKNVECKCWTWKESFSPWICRRMKLSVSMLIESLNCY